MVQTTQEGEATIEVAEAKRKVIDMSKEVVKDIFNPRDEYMVRLVIDGGVLMSNTRRTHEGIEASIRECPLEARAFIGGLGLGIVLFYLAKLNKTKEIIVAELSKSVIELMEPPLREWFEEEYPNFNWKVVHGDAEEVVSDSGLFDWIFFDIWERKEDTASLKKIKSKAEACLSDRGKLTLWVDVVRKIEKKRQATRRASRLYIP